MHYWHYAIVHGLCSFFSRACYFEDREDPYVIRPFPLLWKCDVVVPHGLDPISLDTKHLQTLCKSLEVLVRIRNGVKEFGLSCGKRILVQYFI